MIISNEVKKNIKVAIFSPSNSILDVVKKEIEDVGYKVVEYTQIDVLKSNIQKGKIKVLLLPESLNLSFNEFNLENTKVILYDDKNLNMDVIKVELYYNCKLIENEEKIDYEKYKLELVGNLVESISHKIQANLLILGASQNIIKMLSEDKDENAEKKDILNNLYSKNDNALDKANVLLQLVSNATNISYESIMSGEEIEDTINLILDEYLKDNLKVLTIDKKLKEGTYICGPLNDVIFVTCRIVKHLVELNETSIKVCITEDEDSWFFKIGNANNCDTDFLDKIKRFVTYVKNVKYKYANDSINLVIKKIK